MSTQASLNLGDREKYMANILGDQIQWVPHLQLVLYSVVREAAYGDEGVYLHSFTVYSV